MNPPTIEVHVFRSGRDLSIVSAQPFSPFRLQNENRLSEVKLMSIQDAADALGYTVKGLRKIIDRSRERANGARIRGPTIKFFQTMKGAPVKFKEEWIEEFIVEHTVHPETETTKQPKRAKRLVPALENSGLRRELLDI